MESKIDILTEGKTKIIFRLHYPGQENKVIVQSKDDITAGDGKKHDVWKEKGRIANQTTCNVFRLLNNCGIPTAFIAEVSKSTFSAYECEMIPYEVVLRREAHGSALKRNPEFSRGQYFPKIIVEFFFKTKNNNWNNRKLVCDDPLIKFHDDRIELFDAATPIQSQKSFLTLHDFPLQRQRKVLEEISFWAKKVFYILEKSWQLLGKKLVDLKLEFGFINTPTGKQLVLSDVVDNDSWRVLEENSYLDKQVYRDGGGREEVMRNFQKVADLTSLFTLPKQKIIFWRGSDKDDFKEAEKAYVSYTMSSFSAEQDLQYGLERLANNDDCLIDFSIVKSVHKKPIESVARIHQLIQETPNSVLVVLVGMSNGAAPTLSGQITIPVITVPANIKEHPEDVWSSLRMPSDMPVMVVGDVKNAILNALRILAANNPRIYAELRIRQEENLTNFLVC